MAVDSANLQMRFNLPIRERQKEDGYQSICGRE